MLIKGSPVWAILEQWLGERNRIIMAEDQENPQNVTPPPPKKRETHIHTHTHTDTRARMYASTR